MFFTFCFLKSCLLWNVVFSVMSCFLKLCLDAWFAERWRSVICSSSEVYGHKQKLIAAGTDVPLSTCLISSDGEWSNVLICDCVVVLFFFFPPCRQMNMFLQSRNKQVKKEKYWGLNFQYWILTQARCYFINLVKLVWVNINWREVCNSITK